MNFTLIQTKHFQPLLAVNLAEGEIELIKDIKSGMSADQYAGYSPKEQYSYNQIKDIVGARKVDYIEI